ncbi:MAG: BREX system P-loop protein BrxC [Pyrinomonadaceae bacterium]
MERALSDVLTQNENFPCTLIVLDEVQQFIGDNPERTLKVQEVVEVCSKKFDGRILIVGTGQSALSGIPQLQKLQGRFRISLHLSDTDVETVIRKVVLAKKPDKVPVVRKVLSDYSGEISRQLVGTKIEPSTEDAEHDVEDYPLLPVRNRFWEHVLRAVDYAGMSGQLRNQLKIVHEAVKQNACEQVGTVIAGDFIYDQISTDLQQTNVLHPEMHSTIQKQRNGTADGILRSRICALVFLIGKLPRENGADIGLRATSDVLADLLVQDLKAGGAALRTKVPELLRELTESRDLIQVNDEYRLQTKESSAWDADYRDRFNKITGDEGRYASERADVLRTACGERIKTLKLSHGASSVGRKLEVHFSQQAPDPQSAAIPVWVRDGWGEDENAMLADARRAGTESPVIYIFIPRRDNDELKRAIAGKHAADETLQVRGIPATASAEDARQSIVSRQAAANRSLQSVLENIFSGTRVLLAGGGEYTGATLNDMVLSAAKDALTRLYPQFDIADHAKWETVAKRARSGDGGALEVVDYNGDPEGHPVCAAVLRKTSVGKRGSELRRHFAGPPYGWPQDAVDGALLTLLVAGKIKATQDGKAIEPKQLDGTRIGTSEFRSEQTTLTAAQRLAIRKLFQDAAVEVQAK